MPAPVEAVDGAQVGVPQTGQAPAATSTFTIGANFTGSNLSESHSIPPDTMGAVGPAHVVELLNGRYAVYDRGGKRLTPSTWTLNDFWTSAGAGWTGVTFDPRVVYDPDSGRWFAAAVDNPRLANNFLVAVSDGADPTAGWTGWALDSDVDDSHWADFPMLGLNGEVVVVSAIMFPLGSQTPRVSVLVLPKSELTAATPTVANNTLFGDIDPNETGFGPQPIYDPGGSALPLPLLSAYNKGAGTLKRSNIGGSATGPLLDTGDGFIDVIARNPPPEISQPDSDKAPIDAGDNRFSGNVVLRQIPGRSDPSLWGVHGVEIDGRAAIEWYEIDTVTNVVLQSGTIGDPVLAFNYPSIAVNDLGEVVIGFSGGSGSAGDYMSTYVVAGTTESGATTFTDPWQTQTGVAGYEQPDGSGRNRWGDYSATVLDPLDERRFWTFQEFVSAEDVWAVQITEIILSLPAVTPTLTISADPFALAWSTDPANCSYEVYSSTAPYQGFTLVATLAQGEDAYTPADAGQQAAYYYVEAVSCVGGERARSGTVGWFRFALVPGT